MARCPQGRDLVVTLINTPDFFARSRIYERAKIFLAEERGEVVGSAAVAVRDLSIGGVPRRVGYEFQVFAAPAHRRKGIAQRLRAAIESHLESERADLTTAIVAAGNTPSERHVGAAGFRPIGELDLRFLIAGDRPRPTAAGVCAGRHQAICQRSPTCSIGPGQGITWLPGYPRTTSRTPCGERRAPLSIQCWCTRSGAR